MRVVLEDFYVVVWQIQCRIQEGDSAGDEHADVLSGGIEDSTAEKEDSTPEHCYFSPKYAGYC